MKQLLVHVCAYFKNTRIRYMAAGVTVLLAAGVLIVFYAHYLRDNSIASWKGRLSALADDRKIAIEAYLSSRASNALQIAAFPVSSFIVEYSYGRARLYPGAENPAVHVSALLESAVKSYGYTSAYIVNADIRVLARSAQGPPIDMHCRDRLKSMLKRNDRASFDLHRHPDGSINLLVMVPIRGPRSGPPVGAVILMMDPHRWLYPLLTREPVPTGTAETLLVRNEGNAIVFLSPLRFSTHKPLEITRPLSDPVIAANYALEGKKIFGEFIDYRNVRILASTNNIPATGWGIVAKVDRSEALRRYYGQLLILLTALTGLIAALGGMAYGFWKDQRSIHFRTIARQELHRRALMERANDIILFMDPEGYIREANHAAEKAYGRPADELTGMNVADLRSPETRDQVKEQIAKAIGEGIRFEAVHMRSDGTAFPVEVSSRGITIDGESMTLSIIRDISERVDAEKRIRHANRLYAVLSQVNQAIVQTGGRDELLSEICRVAVDYGGFVVACIDIINPESSVLETAACYGTKEIFPEPMNFSKPDAPEGDDPALTVIHTGSYELYNDIMNDHRMARHHVTAAEYGYHSMAVFPVKLKGRPIGAMSLYSAEKDFFTDEEISLFSEIVGDISFALDSFEHERSRLSMEEELRASEQKYRELVETAGSIIIRWDMETKITFINEYARGFFGYSVEEIIGKELAGTIVPETEKNRNHLAQIRSNIALDPDRYASTENENMRRDGSRVWITWTNKPLYDDSGKIREILSIGIDISDRKIAETALIDSLHEKELLIKEVHHRVKNNMQIIISMMNLQQKNLGIPEFTAMLDDTINRIRSMALVHENLYRSKNLSRINFGEYLRTIAHSLMTAYAGGFDPLHLDLNVEDTEISIDQAIPCGLLVNEILTNSLKHAFPGRQDGVICVGFTRKPAETGDSPDVYVLTLSDNGIGMKDFHDAAETRSLGFSIINALVEQLSGKMDINTREGTRYTIRFPASEREQKKKPMGG